MLSHIVLLTTWVMSLVFLSASQYEMSFHHRVMAWSAGWIAWTLVEYLLNRYLLHPPGSSIGFLNAIIHFHLQHHEEPDSIQFNFMHPLLVGFTVMPVMVVSFFIAEGTGLLITSGFIFGYLAFIVLHTCQHHYTTPTIWFLKNLWENHYLHHKSFPHKAYGVSTSLWDFVFRTLPSKRNFLTIDAKNMKTPDRTRG